MQRLVAMVFGYFVLLLGVIGLVAGNGHLLGLLNIDTAIDVGRIGLAALLLYAVYGARSSGLIRTSLFIFAVVYLAIGLLGLVNREMFGLMPSGVSTFDIIFNLAGGAVAFVVALGPNRRGESPVT